MVLKKLFQKYRKTEPTEIFILKQFVLTLLLVSLIGYTWLIIWDIYSDNPVVQNSLIEENSFSIPEFLFITPKASISCNFKNANGIYDCTKYVIQPQFDHTDKINISSYKASFFTNELLFSKIPNNGLSSLEFMIYINDSNFNASDYSSLPYVVFQMKNTGTASDISYDDYTNSIQSQKDSLGLYSRFSRTINILNLYSIASYSSYKFKLTRKRKDIMLPSWENYIGFSSKLVKTSYFTSSMETFPFQNDTATSLLKIAIEQPTYTVQVETDKRNKTVVSSLGLIGGAWGFATSIYALLFGTDSIKPWGLIQKYGYKINHSVQTNLEKTLEYIPLVNHPKSITLNNNDLKRRLDSLQLFLIENVIDVQHLEGIYKTNVKKYKKGTN